MSNCRHVARRTPDTQGLEDLAVGPPVASSAGSGGGRGGALSGGDEAAPKTEGRR